MDAAYRSKHFTQPEPKDLDAPTRKIKFTLIEQARVVVVVAVVVVVVEETPKPKSKSSIPQDQAVQGGTSQEGPERGVPGLVGELWLRGSRLG